MNLKTPIIQNQQRARCPHTLVWLVGRHLQQSHAALSAAHLRGGSIDDRSSTHRDAEPDSSKV